MKKLGIGLLTTLFFCGFSQAQTKHQNNHTQKKILFVVTSHGEKGSTGEKTGYYLSEVTHPWKVLTEAGYAIDYVSPKGGNPPVDGFDMDDETNKEFWENDSARAKLTQSFKPSEIDAENYVAIYYAGGHGAMWDLPNEASIAKIASQIYENKGVVAAVCHGSAGLLNIKLSNGKYLVDGKKINAFTNEEEQLIGLTEIVPFLLENELKNRGGLFEKSAPWSVHTISDQRVITGQNPQSATEVGEKIKLLLQK